MRKKKTYNFDTENNIHVSKSPVNTANIRHSQKLHNMQNAHTAKFSKLNKSITNSICFMAMNLKDELIQVNKMF